MAESTPIPIILCGKTEVIGRAVVAALKPEIEVIHFVLAGESGPSIIPPLLAGQAPPFHAESSSLGSGDYTKVPRAVLLGGAFDEEATAPLREAVRVTPNTRSVPWVRLDSTKSAPPVGSPEYAQAVTQRSKDALLRLEKDGKLDGSHEGVEWY
ncbi:hypothetical protein FZEAL_6146 [Fusarium zealandicum]|uniref:Uncharacterized protein n=1 Tax=Fusarium zealandicum TaxID=1053134 RepID=A0A8H4UIE9_9HYPO|nr:hypothetical protein FZEAL_6146 [Fusarium zealandicum]